MIKTRLLNLVPNCKKYIATQILCQWLKLFINVAMIFSFGNVLDILFLYAKDSAAVSNIEIFAKLLGAVAMGALAAVWRFSCTIVAGRMSFLSASKAKTVLRKMIYEKLLKIGTGYNEKVATSEIVQLATEGVEQLESYFGLYVPQFFYALLSPITLFAVLFTISAKASIVLLICVPLIPIALMAVQTIARKLLSRYWKQYANWDCSDSARSFFASEKLMHEKLREIFWLFYGRNCIVSFFAPRHLRLDFLVAP